LENAAKKLCDMRAPRASQIMHYQYTGFDNPAVKPSRYGPAERSSPRFLGAAGTAFENVFSLNNQALTADLKLPWKHSC
jgi:hypothetical protein